MPPGTALIGAHQSIMYCITHENDLLRFMRLQVLLFP